MDNGLAHGYAGLASLRDDVYEYFLVAEPADNIVERITSERRSIIEEYQLTIRECQPFIHIARFEAREAMEDTITRWLQRIIAGRYSFSCVFNNYNALPPDTIYVRVLDAQPFNEIQQQLKIISQYLIDNSLLPVYSFLKPCLRLAGNLQGGSYEKIVWRYARKFFNDTCKVDRIKLFKIDHKGNFRQQAVFGMLPEQK